MVTKKTGRQKKLEPGKGDQPITNFFPRTKRIPAAVKRDEDLKRIYYHLDHGDPEDGFEVTTFPDKGKGVLATRSFKKGDFIVEYSGELLTHKEAMVSAEGSDSCYNDRIISTGKGKRARREESWLLYVLLRAQFT